MVGSSDPHHAREYAAEVGAPLGGTYEDVVANGDLTAVYVGNNHVDHPRAAHLAIEAGLPVLVEKPFAVSRREAADVFEHARSRGVFAMEGMWSRFLPPIQQLIDTGQTIGTIHRAAFALGRDQRGRFPRIFDAARAGGALLDMGVYAVAVAHMLLGPADEVVEAVGRLEDGVDLEVEMTTRHGPTTARLTTAADRDLADGILLEGERGRIVVTEPLHHPTAFDVHREGTTTREHVPFEGHGFEYEIAAMQRAIEKGWGEEPRWSRADTLATHAVLDEVRRRIGLVYPFETGVGEPA